MCFDFYKMKSTIQQLPATVHFNYIYVASYYATRAGILCVNICMYLIHITCFPRLLGLLEYHFITCHTKLANHWTCTLEQLSTQKWRKKVRTLYHVSNINVYLGRQWGQEVFKCILHIFCACPEQLYSFLYFVVCIWFPFSY